MILNLLYLSMRFSSILPDHTVFEAKLTRRDFERLRQNAKILNWLDDNNPQAQSKIDVLETDLPFINSLVAEHIDSSSLEFLTYLQGRYSKKSRITFFF